MGINKSLLLLTLGLLLGLALGAEYYLTYVKDGTFAPADNICVKLRKNLDTDTNTSGICARWLDENRPVLPAGGMLISMKKYADDYAGENAYQLTFRGFQKNGTLWLWGDQAVAGLKTGEFYRFDYANTCRYALLKTQQSVASASFQFTKPQVVNCLSANCELYAPQECPSNCRVCALGSDATPACHKSENCLQGGGL